MAEARGGGGGVAGGHDASASGPSPTAGPRKRARSPMPPPFTADYRPYTGGQLQRAYGWGRQGRGGGHKEHWDLYYRNNTINGYKDRHYILREFVELRERIDKAAMGCEGEGATEAAAGFSWMEAGCGVGNAMLPIFKEYGHLRQWRRLLGFDISAVAIGLLEEKKSQLPLVLAAKLHCCVLDPCIRDVADCPFFRCTQASMTDTASQCPSSSTPPPQLRGFPDLDPVEFVSLVFVLCSIPVESHGLVLRRIAACMSRRGGVLFFRDYCVADHAQNRFRKNKAGISDGTENTYARTNGTLSHFFSIEEVQALFESVGFSMIDLGVVEREVTNRREDLMLSRKFIQGRFRLESAGQ